MSGQSGSSYSPQLSPQECRLHASLLGGLAHLGKIAPHDPRPNEPVTLLFSVNETVPIDQIVVYYTIDGSPPLGRKGIASNGRVVFANRMEGVYQTKSNIAISQWQAVLPGHPEGTLVLYRVEGWEQAESRRCWMADSGDPTMFHPPEGHLFAFHIDEWRPPDWVRDAVIYQVVVDRFHAACDEPPLRDPATTPIDAVFGGTLQGLIEKLDYVEHLGANCLLLSPVFESSTYHGYDISDHCTVARRYGSNQTLHQLITEAHRRGMRVILDFIAAHTSNKHPLFIEASQHPESALRSWYTFNDELPGGYRSFFGVPYLPELATEQVEVQQYLFNVAAYWINEFGVDGLRLDYMLGPSHAFWALFQRALKQWFPHVLTLGEILPASPSEILEYEGRVDAFMDFPLMGMLRDVFAWRKTPLSELLTMLKKRSETFVCNMARITLLDNHDIPRFLRDAGGEKARLRLAAICQMTLEGAPLIYYGTEIGFSQPGEADYEKGWEVLSYTRLPMVWDERQDHVLLAYYRRLLQLRKKYAALRQGAWTWLTSVNLVTPAMGDSRQVAAYLRHVEQECLLVILNNLTEPARVRFSVGEQFTVEINEGIHDMLTGSTFEAKMVDGMIEVEIPALDAIIAVI